MRHNWALVALLATTATWGATFVMVKDAVAHMRPLAFLAVRFWIAAVALLLVWAVQRPRAGRAPSRALLAGGVLTGAALAAGYLLQTYGLTLTSPSDAGILTGLFVVFTPAGAWVVHRLRPRAVTLLVTTLCFLGTALLAGPGGHRAQMGDLLVVGCAAAFAAHILLLARFSPNFAPVALAAMQMLAAAVAFSVLAVITGQGLEGWGDAIPALAVTGLLASAGGFLVQTAAQRRLSATRTAVLLSTEPVFAVLFTVALAGVTYQPLQWAGAALVLGALLAHEWWAGRSGALAWT